jgi:sigma-B regulation protein RsbU (phosphoserine phosphatase)
MIGRIKKMLASSRVRSNLLLIIIAAVLLEMISGVQYYYSHSLLEKELEKQAEMELTMKSLIAGSTRKNVENMLNSHIWDMKQNLVSPDSMFEATKWLLRSNSQLAGAGIAFTPDYYPQKGRLFEPYAYWSDGKIKTIQISDLGHDYTQSSIFRKVMETDSTYWSSRYYDSLVTNKHLICYCLPLHDSENKTVAVLYMDVDTEWLGDTLNYNNIFPSSFELLLTREGELVAGPDETLVSKTTVDYVVSLINDSTIEKHNSENGHCRVVKFRDPDDGDEGLLFISRLKGGHQWQVAVVCYEDEVFDEARTMRVLMLLLMAVAVILLGAIVNRFARNHKRLEMAKIEKNRIDSELRIAKGIQREMLPETWPPYPERKDIDIYGLLLPAREVGGDLFDFFIRNDKLHFCIGDVSGKGIPAAMVMSVTHSLFRSASAHENNPVNIMQSVNETSCIGNKSNMFVTLLIGVLDLPTGRLRYCNAGHDAPFVIHDGNCSVGHCEANLPIGIFDDFKYVMQETVLAPETTVFLYTDGVTEAKNKLRKQFGLTRVQKVLEDHCQESPEELLKTMAKEVQAFAGEAEQSDDLTMLAFRYTPQQEENILNETLTLKNDVRQVSQLSNFIKSVAEQLQIEPAVAKNIRLGVEEAVVNVMDYAYPAGSEGDICVVAKANGQWLKYIISDSGVAFDPTEVLKTDTTLSAEERPIGGLGILLVRELMDTINYERIDGKNILTLTKMLNK